MADYIVWFGSDEEPEAFKESPSIDEPEEDNIFATPDISNVEPELIGLMKVALGLLVLLTLATVWAWRRYGNDIEKFYRAVHGGRGLREFAAKQQADEEAEHWSELITHGGSVTGGNTPTTALSPVVNTAHLPKSPIATNATAKPERKSLTPTQSLGRNNQSPRQAGLTLPGGSLANSGRITQPDNETDLSLTTDRASSMRHRNTNAGGDSQRSMR
jgi:hypothetical protein